MAEEEELPLFATHVPAGGLTPGLQAIAALIDEQDDDAPVPPASASRKRKASSMGTAQVHLSLASCGGGETSCAPPEAKRTATASDSGTKGQRPTDVQFAEMRSIQDQPLNTSSTQPKPSASLQDVKMNEEDRVPEGSPQP